MTSTSPTNLPTEGLTMSPTETTAPLAIWPECEEDVNADSLARALAVQATERGALHSHLRRINPTAWTHSCDALMLEWALCYVLREISPSDGDRLALSIWHAARDGSQPYELPPEWMAEYGMDADALIARVRSAGSPPAGPACPGCSAPGMGECSAHLSDCPSYLALKAAEAAERAATAGAR